jgi:D-lactate dehydrogenase (cytochrome)
MHSPLPASGPVVIPSDLLARFTAIVGAKYALTDPNDVAPYLIEQRGIYQGRTPLVLRPGSVAEVSAILKLANETRTAIVPMGGNTGLVGGQMAFNGEIVLSVARLDKVREVDAASNTMTCEAGVILMNAQNAAADAGRLYPLSLGSEGSCTVGGNLSSNAGGLQVVAYGNARELTLGLEVVLADGRIWNGLNKLKKDNTGYDLKNLFVGAEGTLGIITAAVLKLFPRPRSVETAFVGVPSPRAALDLLSLTRDHAAGTVTSFELISRTVLEMGLAFTQGAREPLDDKHPWYVLMELSSQAESGLHEALEDVLGNALERGIVTDGVLASSIDQAKSFWRLREQLTEAQKPAGGSIKHDISVPIAVVPEFLEEATAAVQKMVPGCRPAPFGHLGDGNLHYNVSQPVGADKAEFIALWDEMNDLVHGIVAKYQGSVSAEHGIGVMKRDILPKVKDPVAMELMRTLKATLDPNGILNPGKVL